MIEKPQLRISSLNQDVKVIYVSLRKDVTGNHVVRHGSGTYTVP